MSPARNMAALGAGVLFGLGLAISQMVNPAKVLAFLDVGGNWDPSLALVMGGALAVTGVAFRLVLKRPRPMFGDAFAVPTRGDVDGRLVGGAIVFGVGWGLIGLCPGPAMASIAYGMAESVYFLGAMLAGMAAARILR